MRPLFVLVTLFITLSTPVLAAELNLPLYSKIYDDKRNPFDDAVAALTLAQQTNRNVLIEIGGNWCVWCHKMDRFLAKNPELYQQLHQKFVLLKVNVSDSNENVEFMKSLPPVLGYPHMYISDAQGKLLKSKDTAEFQQNGGHSVKLWQAFINKWQVAQTKQQPLANNQNKVTD